MLLSINMFELETDRYHFLKPIPIFFHRYCRYFIGL